VYEALTTAGFEADVRRRTYYQPVTLGVVQAATNYRAQIQQLANLPDQVFEERCDALDGLVEQQGSDHVIGSEFCLIEVMAKKI
jgi:hypothetical protein